MSIGHTGRIVSLALAGTLALTTATAGDPTPAERDAHEREEHAREAREAHAAAATLPAAEAADRLLARLRYVRVDYAEAVVNGRVVDEHEYEEQVEMIEDAMALTASLPLSTGARTALGAIAAAVERHAPAEDVATACDALLTRLSDELWLELDAPDPARLADGAALYATNCASCHGARGEGPATDLGLVPAPVAFREAGVAAQLSPRRVYEAVTFGVPETAMVARADTLSDAERWALAFHVARMGAPPASAEVPPRTLEELAESTNASLASEAPSGTVPAAAVAAWRGPEVKEAATSPWFAMREDVRVAALRNANSDAALDRVRARWKEERKPVAKTDPLLAMQVDTALAAMATSRRTETRARDAARALDASLAEVEKRMR